MTFEENIKVLHLGALIPLTRTFPEQNLTDMKVLNKSHSTLAFLNLIY